jgi:hypothetical protein
VVLRPMIAGVAGLGCGVLALALWNARRPGSAAAAAEPIARSSGTAEEPSPSAIPDLAAPREAPRSAPASNRPVESAPPAGSAAPTALESVLAWLSAAAPDEYGNLSAADLERLTEIDLRGTKCTDADLERLVAALPSLETISLRETAITDAGLASLRGLPKLAYLDLRDTSVTGSGLREIPSQLQALHLTSTKVTGEDLRWLPRMPYLKVLKLNFLTMGDESLADLSLFPAVEHLELDGTSCTDAGLRQLLAQNPTLRRIEARYTNVTPEGVSAVLREHPELVVVFGTDFDRHGLRQ